jgi:hypothetical protein
VTNLKEHKDDENILEVPELSARTTNVILASGNNDAKPAFSATIRGSRHHVMLPANTAAIVVREKTKVGSSESTPITCCVYGQSVSSRG